MDTKTFLIDSLKSNERDTEIITSMSEEVVNSNAPGADFCSREECWRYLKSPSYWGLLAKQVIRHPSIKEETKTRAAQISLRSGNMIPADQQPSPWPFESAHWLISKNEITREDLLGLRGTLIRSSRYESECVESLEKIKSCVSSVLWFNGLSHEEKVEISIICLLSKEVIGNQGSQVIKSLMNTEGYLEIKKDICKKIISNAIPFDSEEYSHPIELSTKEKDLLSIKFMPENIRRAAVYCMAHLSNKPYKKIKLILENCSAKDFGKDSIMSGVVDVIDDMWDRIGEENGRKMLERAIMVPDTGIRKRAYIVGQSRLGEEFLKKSLNDKAKSVNEWGEFRLSKHDVSIVE